jgi:dTDP-4-dehydrorhamnose 3,5-epimerase
MNYTIAAALSIDVACSDAGIGVVIQSAEDKRLIDGVSVSPVTLWPDDRGYFLEIARMGRGLSCHFDPASTQVSAALSYPGTIKAFHFHRYQTDLWVPTMGMFQVALVDLRPESKSFGVKNTLYVGALRPWQVLIPPGVGHGYKVIGSGPAMLTYLTNRFYDPQDEGRIPYNDSRIAYDWEVQHK